MTGNAVAFAGTESDTATVASANQSVHLSSLDYAVVQQCMHCGLCLPTCPTYESTKHERHSPRGRIALMRAITDGRLEATERFAREMYFCLGCLACMSACPAGVNYSELLEHARAEAETSGALKSWHRGLLRAVVFRWLFRDLRRLQLAGAALRLYQQLGLQRFLRHTGLLKLLPARLRQLEAMTPDMAPAVSAELIPPFTPAQGRRRYRVALLTGCVQDLIFSGVNRDSAEVLARNGCEVVTPPEQSCCGSLYAHSGEWELARELARRQLDQFPPEQFDALITNAGGCGSHLRHFERLLAADPLYRDKARLWDSKVNDIHEWLVKIGFQAPVPATGLAPPPLTRAAYQESCHLAHGQKITLQPRQVLSAVPGLVWTELPESSWCCGSAGVYNLTHPDMAESLLRRKLRHIESAQATLVATGNPGCMLQLALGARRHGMDLRVAHPVSLLAEAYRQAEPLYAYQS